MGKDVHFTLKPGTALTAEEIAMIELARSMQPTYDEDNPEIDPSSTPAQYAALMEAVGKRNRRLAKNREPA